MIPKRIHYCWFGRKPYPPLVERCMKSWIAFCPDYEVFRWDDQNVPLADNEYVRQAYAGERWAFVSDYVRLRALAAYGGLYLDTDVELVRPVDRFLNQEGFMGFESAKAVATCVIGAEAGHPFITRLAEAYSDRAFLRVNGTADETTNVAWTTREMVRSGLKLDGTRQQVDGMTIYPADYFSPKDLRTGRLSVTAQTVAIHHLQASWMSPRQRFHTRAAQWLGPRNTERLKRLMGRTHDD